MASEDRRIEIKNTDQILRMRRAGMVVAQIHQALKTACEPGTTTGELDQVSAAVIARMGAKSNFLGYDGFPATVCISVNEEVIHGIPGNRVLQFGDLVSFDCGAYVLDCNNRQWHADAAFTMVCGGEEHARPEDLQLMTTTQRALWSGIAALAKAQHLGEIGDAVEEVVYEDSLRFGWEAGIVEEYVGHGIGTSLHQAPDVLNFSTRSRGPKIKTGMVLAIEPMLTRGGAVTKELADGWTVVTVDGSRAAHFEHTVAVLPGGVWVLTEPDGGRSGLAPFGLSPRAIAPRG
ncbi:type I methionyl aminopeptidase [Mobiluncus mulieris]|uniref:Methionine aminopeptidase n=2 Tax=Mobiluncus mulieris TaxID=2052 RepID=E0QTL6_9ACTO|nr:type I methionyl aminopeptidase [Mobiluncus mulieris]EEJ53328.1 methionine aminopeptidase, type I [Mobiluncus mulieris ATCC 35243]EEZ91310.1 methionine aminopeptidase, type I [Mobiluncus mulieris 28-1]EFM45060.1 methionine aminopeptidase, type I [Mobiluncus mulieris ATCC 35239]EFN92837.1 methionine aminopeptidase, type I [Mobiluncus mulieris FB024-16]MBB5845367.1 methionyl aminopeptidase [Mobiluncus mulieris]